MVKAFYSRKVTSVSDIQWKAFNIGGEDGLFTITSTNSGIDKNKLLSLEGKVPYITRTDKNNGIDMFIGTKQDKKYKLNDGNVISIGLDTQTVFYQAKPFYTGQNLQILTHPNLNPEIATFLIPLLEIQMKKFNWGGNGATLTRLNRTKIVLPIKNGGNPDWEYMESYIKQARVRKEKHLHKFLNDELKQISKYKIVNISDAKWKEFKIEDFAIVNGGQDWTSKERVKGKTPFIGASSVMNGITDFIDKDAKPNYVAKNAVSINRNGSIGYSFFHPYDAYFSGDTRFLELSADEVKNEYIGLFITTVIRLQKDKYMYGYKMGTERIKKQKVFLPIKNDGKVDYDFMENYIKGLKAKKIQEVLKFLK